MNDCELRIYDPFFNWIDATMLSESVQFERNYTSTGSFEIHINSEKLDFKTVWKEGNIIIINGDPRKAGIIRNIKIDENRNASTAIITGDNSTGLLKQRIIIPPDKDEVENAFAWDKIEANSETVMKHYVSKNLAFSKDNKRNMSNFFIGEDFKRGEIIPWKARYSVLSDEIEKISIYSEIGFEVLADLVNKRWVFDVYEGKDLTVGSDYPVSFRADFQNLESYIYTEDSSEYKSTAYAAGSGIDEDRLIYTLSTEVNGIDRWEVFLDISNAVDIDELIFYANYELKDMKKIVNLSPETISHVYIWDKDFKLGDLVSVYIDKLDLEKNMRISQVKEVWERDKAFNFEITFGDKLPNIYTILKNK